MKSKTWKLWLFSGICSSIVGVLYLIDKNYLLGGIFTLLGIFDIAIGITNFTRNKKSKQIKVSDKVSKNMDIELRKLIAEGKQNKAIKKYRMVTGIGLKEAKEYVDLLSKKKSKKLF